MLNSSVCRRAAALLLAVLLACLAALQGLAAYPMPIRTVSDAESVYLFDAATGKPILEQNAAPAPLYRQPDQDDDRPAAAGKRPGPAGGDHHPGQPEPGI